MRERDYDAERREHFRKVYHAAALLQKYGAPELAAYFIRYLVEEVRQYKAEPQYIEQVKAQTRRGRRPKK